jgi:peptidoglycan/LPS O-acetylase OafA/YrhL
MSDASRDHLPALDGLRGLAVLGVLAFHGGYGRGGYLGVDLFFVLSGFLITRLLVAEHERTGAIRLGAFWVRRARRLLPALLLLVVGVTSSALASATSAELARLRADALATLLYVANWRAIFAGNEYWGLFRAPSPLEHMWSLAIEEQFYAVWPIAVAAALAVGARRGAGRGALLALTTGLLAASASLAIALYAPDRPTARVYFGTDTRAPALLMGALLAVLAPRVLAPSTTRAARAALEVAGAVSAVLLAVAWAALGGEGPPLYRGGLLAAGVAATVVVACAAHPRPGVLARGLAWAPLGAVGKVSYGLYLVHWPVFGALGPARVGLDGAPLFALRVAVSAVVSVASYALVEMPVRRGAFPRWRGAAVAALSFGAALGLVLAVTDGATPDPEPGREAVVDSPSPAAPGGVRVLVVGDSVAQMLGAGAAAEARAMGISLVNRGVTGCGLARGENRLRLPSGKIVVRARCTDWEERWARDVDEARPDVAVLVMDAPSAGDLDVGGRWLHACEPEFDAWYFASVRRAIEVLGARGAAVLVATAPFVAAPEEQATRDARARCINRSIERAVETIPYAEVADLGRRVCPSFDCLARVNGVVLRPDGTHFTAAGAGIALRWLLDPPVPLAELRANHAAR